MKSFSGSSFKANLASTISLIIFLTSIRYPSSYLSFLVKFIVLTFSPKNKENRIFSPVRDLSNIVVVKSAKAIDRGTLPTFL
jgi:hypothetical protein